MNTKHQRIAMEVVGRGVDGIEERAEDALVRNSMTWKQLARAEDEVTRERH